MEANVLVLHENVVKFFVILNEVEKAGRYFVGRRQGRSLFLMTLILLLYLNYHFLHQIYFTYAPR